MYGLTCFQFLPACRVCRPNTNAVCSAQANSASYPLENECRRAEFVLATRGITMPFRHESVRLNKRVLNVRRIFVEAFSKLNGLWLSVMKASYLRGV